MYIDPVEGRKILRLKGSGQVYREMQHKVKVEVVKAKGLIHTGWCVREIQMARMHSRVG